ncbi:unnamed protein product [Peniophora sp. CBMAI 1063]|nr:unnamed protein product [Peniophora sp. CBMAI 1063]
MLDLTLSASSSLELRGKIEALDRFQRILTAHKDDILHVMPSKADPVDPPPKLVGSILRFVCLMCGMEEEEAQRYWELLREAIWHCPKDLHDEALSDLYRRFKNLTARAEIILWPPLPNHRCLTSGCHRQQTAMLTKTENTDVLIFTSKGTIPSVAVQLTCDHCGVNYRHDYYVKEQKRYYYSAEQRAHGTDQYVQVGEHHFVERDLCEAWTLSMLNAWVSNSNIAAQYNQMLPFLERSHKHRYQYDYVWRKFMRPEHVWTAFAVHALLQHHDRHGSTLVVPHGGLQDVRFKAAMEARSTHIQEHGQEELMHFCDKCCRQYVAEDGTTKRVWCVVVDGLTLGRPCCSAHINGAPCTEPLGQRNDHFCRTHHDLHDVCRVRGCNSQIRPGALTCADPGHAATEQAHKERNTASFRLKERVNRIREANAMSGLGVELDLTAVEGLDALDEDQDVLLEVSVERPPGSVSSTAQPLHGRPRSNSAPTAAPKVKITAQLSRRRTHNEQLAVYPCGMIAGRATFFFAESITACAIFLKRLYLTAAKPDHLAYDTNCKLSWHVRNDPWFDSIGLSVDVFHFNSKHSEEDRWCREHCDPNNWPELKTDDGGYFFNTSIAEQTNSWLGRYHSMCREMLPFRYDFFLDEMIRRRNIVTKEKLTRDGLHPWYFSADGRPAQI